MFERLAEYEAKYKKMSAEEQKQVRRYLLYIAGAIILLVLLI